MLLNRSVGLKCQSPDQPQMDSESSRRGFLKNTDPQATLTKTLKSGPDTVTCLGNQQAPSLSPFTPRKN